MSKKDYEKRFGITAIEMGFSISDQLIEAMRLQIEQDLSENKHKLIGEHLVELGYMERTEVDQVLKKMYNKKKV